jgi:hypothetical protein
LDARQSISDHSATQQTLLITLISPLLFDAPDVHNRALQSIWKNERVTFTPRNDFIRRLNRDWEQYILFVSILFSYGLALTPKQATVILNANVGFLTIKNIGGTGNVPSAAEIASYLSMLTSTGSIITGLLLVRQNKTKDREESHKAVVGFFP